MPAKSFTFDYEGHEITIKGPTVNPSFCFSLYEVTFEKDHQHYRSTVSTTKQEEVSWKGPVKRLVMLKVKAMLDKKWNE